MRSLWIKINQISVKCKIYAVLAITIIVSVILAILYTSSRRNDQAREQIDRQKEAIKNAKKTYTDWLDNNKPASRI